MRRVVLTGSPSTRDLDRYLDHLRTSGPYDKAYFNLTVDFELGWSIARRADGATSLRRSLRRSRRARETFPALLELSDEFGIPLTIACVAHLALRDCSHNLPPRFQPSWSRDDWYAVDPKLDLDRARHYYGLDLVTMAMRSDVGHEIASHGFSHVDLGDAETTQEVAQFEIGESYRILKGIEPELSTFVFPKNHSSYMDLLHGAGYAIYRGDANVPIARDGIGLWRFPLGLWFAPIAASPREYTLAVAEGVKHRQVVNFYCHLYEFASARELTRFARPVFRAVAESRDRGEITPATMRTIVHAVAGG
jgi:peptidoglycan/xylan/chitin deacetylase (PgdA/CDA1 family)